MPLVRAAELEQEGTTGLRPSLQVGQEKSLGKNPMPAAHRAGKSLGRGQPWAEGATACLHPARTTWQQPWHRQRHQAQSIPSHSSRAGMEREVPNL